MKNIKIFLGKIRLSNEETQKDMAKKLSISDTALSFIENEVKPVDALFLQKLFSVYELKSVEKQKILGYYLHKKEEEFNKEKQEFIKKSKRVEELIKFSNSNNINKFDKILKELIEIENNGKK